MAIALLLLRALPSLDHAWTDPRHPNVVRSAEEVMGFAKAHIVKDNASVTKICFEVLRGVVTGVRAAGGWRAYDRIPRAEILRLRSLALRRRANLRRLRHDDTYTRSLSFLVRCPREIFWHVLGYWRCQYPDLPMHQQGIVDQLGFR